MKSILFPLATVAILVAAFTVTAPAAESLSVLLQKGIYAEETEGNLESAIKIYVQIAGEAATNRAVVAQAQYRLAMCYQKQGNKEQAIATLNELLKQFPADAALTQKAREQLTALGQAVPSAVTLRKIAVVNGNWFRTVSPGGRFIAYTGDNGEIYIQEPATRKSWQAVKCNWESSPWELVFSPDSRRIAYDLNGTALYTANTDGSEIKEVYKPENKDTICPTGWLDASGQIIAVLEEKAKNTKSVVSIDPKSGVLKRFNLPPQTGRQLSPSANGRYLGIQDGDSLSSVNLESGQQETLVDRHVKKLLGWAHDDSMLFFSSNRTGAGSLWAVAVKAGKAAGEPQLIKEYAESVYLAKVTSEGHVYYTEDNNTANVCVVSANFETGEISDEPRLVTDRYPGVQTAPAWSKDGKKLWLAVQGEQRRFVV